MEGPRKIITAKFYRLPAGREPVREWLLGLPQADRKIIGRDIQKAEFAWPCGPPLCKPLKSYPGLMEVRSSISGGRIARVFFYVAGRDMILLHGFVKKSKSTPEKELKLADKRKKEHQTNE